MPFLLPQLVAVGDDYDGRSPLPARLERIARLDAESVSTREIARRQKVSAMSVVRLRRQDAYAARRAHLAQLAAERAERAAPLAYKGNRVALLDAEVRAMVQHLHANDYKAVRAVNKAGEPIEGFDSERVNAVIKGVMAIDSMTEPKRSTIADTTNVAVSVTMTTEQAVTKVQALLSRATEDGGTPGTPVPPGGTGG